MKWYLTLIVGVLATACGLAQAPIHPVIVSKSESGRQVTVIDVRPHFVTAIRMPGVVDSVAVGDPKLFQAEHSPNEPTVVFVKALTMRPAETNLLISMVGGRETSFLVVNHGLKDRTVDFIVKDKRPTSFLIPSGYPRELIGETVPATEADTYAATRSSVTEGAVSFTSGSDAASDTTTKGRSEALDALLARQERAPLPKLYGEHPGVQNVRGDRVRAGVSEVMDAGERVIALFSAVNVTHHAILLVPPQVELGGKVRRGKIFRHWQWTASEELTVGAFKLNRWRLGPGERADGVVMFERPPYKQSNETLFLQVAEAGAIDKPALVPIGFGVNEIRNSEASDERNGK